LDYGRSHTDRCWEVGGAVPFPVERENGLREKASQPELWIREQGGFIWVLMNNVTSFALLTHIYTVGNFGLLQYARRQNNERPTGKRVRKVLVLLKRSPPEGENQEDMFWML
jgi:hypothetical protein